MCYKHISYFYLILTLKISETARPVIEGSTATAYPCNEHKQFVISIDLSERPELQQYKYFLYIFYNKLVTSSNIFISFSRAIDISLASNNYANLYYNLNRTEATINFFRDKIGGSGMHVTSLNATKIAYITKIRINGEEKCIEPNLGVFDNLIKGPQGLALSLNQQTGPTCGRRQLHHTELITNGIQSKPGDWPWHVAIYRQEKNNFDYKCGGTLISEEVVLTAAHCVMRRGLNKRFPASKLKVYLGKYNLYDSDISAKERQIAKIKIHEKYDITTVDNDIALMLLKDKVEFDSYIQPACVWNPEAFRTEENSDIFGTVVGWGFDTSDRLTSQLRQATMPIIDGFTCILSNHLFFGKYLNEYKFCGGYKNGTSPCNGDSGGGFVIFAPEETDKNRLEGSWYIRGIVSIGVSRRDISICQPNEYVLFTDVSKYKEWIENHMSFNDTEEEVEGDIVNTEVIQVSQSETMEPVACGKKKLLHTELLTNAELTKPGDWPWHTAIYRLDTKANLQYQCGGSILSKNVVLSNGPCVYERTSRKSHPPKEIIVMVGVYNLDGFDAATQKIRTAEIVIHEEFTIETLRNDISLLRLERDVVYNDYIQPICLWKKNVYSRIDRFSTIIGVVPGWGFDENGTISKTLRQASMPIVRDGDCARKSDIFKEYSYKKYCAGFINGTSPCKGDSGGAMAVFIPDKHDPINKDTTALGSWYARGLVSTASVKKDTHGCDAFNYVLFTDLEQYVDWIENVMARWIFKL